MGQVSTIIPPDCYDNCVMMSTLDDAGQITVSKGDATNAVARGFARPRAARDQERAARNRVQVPSLRQEGNSYAVGSSPRFRSYLVTVKGMAEEVTG